MLTVSFVLFLPLIIAVGRALDMAPLASTVRCSASDACDLTDVAFFRNAMHVFGVREPPASMYSYASCNASAPFAVQWHPNAARRTECAHFERVHLIVVDDVLALLQNAARGTVHTSVRASTTFRLHNEFLLPLFHTVSQVQRLQDELADGATAVAGADPTAFVFLPLCTGRWWQILLGAADRFHPDRMHLHHEAHVSSAAIDKLEMPMTPGSVLVRDQLHRWLTALRRLSPLSAASVFDRPASVQEASGAHMQCVSHVHWGRSATPFGRNPPPDISWVADYKRFIWSIYDLDTSSSKIGRPIAMRHLRDGDPFDLQPGGHHLDDDLHVALGFRAHAGADVVSAQALAAAAVRVVHDDAAQRPAARRCVGCPAFEGTDAWCRCCSLNCGGFRDVCVAKDGFCKTRCVGSKWCDATDAPAPPPLPNARAKRDAGKLGRETVSAEQKPIIMLLSGSDRSLHLSSANILQLSQLAAKVGFDFALCCRTVYDHRELVRLVYNADVLVGFASGGGLTNALYMREDALVVQLSSPEEQFADDGDKVVARMAEALQLRFLQIDGLTAQVTRQGLVFDLGALHTIVNRIKIKWRAQ